MSWLEFATLATMAAALLAVWASGRWFDKLHQAAQDGPESGNRQEA
jgi:hypothetical protein